MEQKQEIKCRVLSAGRQLVQSKDHPHLQELLTTLADQWQDLMREMSEAENALINAEMDVLPVRQALSELVAWMDSVSPLIDQDEDTVPPTLEEARGMLHRYKVCWTSLLIYSIPQHLYLALPVCSARSKNADF